MYRPKLSNLREWHATHYRHFDALGKTVVSILTNLLAEHSIPFLSISYRVKSIESFIEKVKRKRYADPAKDCTDILGIRIITYIETDVERAAAILVDSFSIDKKNSLDKGALLETDRIGYRSVHLVASLGETRCALPEFAQFRSNAFEVQMRTVLQHAWAEIEHDRNYKLPSSLPRELERRLYLIAGVLELADREFESLAVDIDKYTEAVTSRSKEGDWNVELNTPSLRVFCNYCRKKFKLARIEPLGNVSSYNDLMEELRDFGITSLLQLEALFTSDTLQTYDRPENITNDFGLMRDVMMFSDLELYFKKAWKRRWFGIEPDDLVPLSRKYGARARELMEVNEIDIQRFDFLETSDSKCG